jgi:hypothetical protein
VGLSKLCNFRLAHRPTYGHGVSLGGQRPAIRRSSLSKKELVESVSAELDSGTLRIGQAGDWEALRDELMGMERTVRQSGSVAYSAPQGRHDDLALALSLCLFGLRRMGSPARRRHIQKQRMSALAWT